MRAFFPVVVVGLVGAAVIVVGFTVLRLGGPTEDPLTPEQRAARFEHQQRVLAYAEERRQREAEQRRVYAEQDAIRARQGMSLSTDIQSSGPPMTSAQAITVCRDQMRRELAPGMSADFPYWHDIDSVRDVGRGVFTLRSYVDSEGLDGEPFRYHYDCVASGGVVTAFELR